MMKNPIRILIVEDDLSIASLLKESLEKEGYVIIISDNTIKAFEKLHYFKVDLCILDIMLPSGNGFELAKDIRKKFPEIPFLFLSALSETKDRLKGFDSGADDFINKPFNMQELIFRVKVILKRNLNFSIQNDSSIIPIGLFDFDYLNRKIKAGGEEKYISNKEAELLKLLADNRGKFIKHSLILKEIWGKEDEFAINSMAVYITKLRKLLKDDSNLKIENLHGTGFGLFITEHTNIS